MSLSSISYFRPNVGGSQNKLFRVGINLSAINNLQFFWKWEYLAIKYRSGNGNSSVIIQQFIKQGKVNKCNFARISKGLCNQQNQTI